MFRKLTSTFLLRKIALCHLGVSQSRPHVREYRQPHESAHEDHLLTGLDGTEPEPSSARACASNSPQPSPPDNLEVKMRAKFRVVRRSGEVPPPPPTLNPRSCYCIMKAIYHLFEAISLSCPAERILNPKQLEILRLRVRNSRSEKRERIARSDPFQREKGFSGLLNSAAREYVRTGARRRLAACATSSARSRPGRRRAGCRA